MKFYGNGVVWNKEENKILCKFVGGTLETENIDIAKKLLNLGYESFGEFPAEVEVEPVTEVEEVKEVEEIEHSKSNRNARKNN